MSEQRNARWSGFFRLAPLLLIAALLALALLPTVPALRIESAAVRRVLPLAEGQRFSIQYLHSVNRSPVIDTIERTGETLTVRSSLFRTYGAGIPILDDGVGRAYTETAEGFLLTGIDAPHEEIALITGTYADHRLLYGNDEFILKRTFGEQTLLRLTAGRCSLLELLRYRLR